jgi:MraZ protein
MADLFLSGRFEHTLDPKGRVTLPARYREHFKSGVVLVRLPGSSCVSVFHPAAWAAYDEKHLEPLDTYKNPAAEQETRMLYMNMDAVVPDAQGRVLISSHHIKDLGLGSKLTILGNRNRLEIWDADKLAAQESDWRGGDNG